MLKEDDTSVATYIENLSDIYGYILLYATIIFKADFKRLTE